MVIFKSECSGSKERCQILCMECHTMFGFIYYVNGYRNCLFPVFHLPSQWYFSKMGILPIAILKPLQKEKKFFFVFRHIHFMLHSHLMSGPLKQHWAKVCNDYMSDKPGRVMMKFNFLLFKTINSETIISGFHKVGVCPFNAILQRCTWCVR